MCIRDRGSPSPGSSETFVLLEGAQFIAVSNDGVGDVDSDGFTDGLDKIKSVVDFNGVTKVGTLTDAEDTWDVYEFTETELDGWFGATGKPAGTYAAQPAGLIQVTPSSTGGS